MARLLPGLYFFMHIETFTVGAFRVNTYLVKDEATGACAIIDTGEGTELSEIIQSRFADADIRMILLTHGHLDHAGSLALLQQHLTVPTYLPRLEKPLFDTLPMQGDWFGEPAFNRPCGHIDHYLDDGDQLMLGETRLQFISTPGHTPGQGCYFDTQDIFVGDTLFAGSIGRTDLPMGDPAVMQASLRKLMQLPGHLRVHSGHGPVTTLENEFDNNPFLAFLR